MCKIETRYRTCLNGSPCLPHYRPSVTHLGFGISAAKLPDRAPFAIYARVLAAIYSGICRQPFEVTDGRILLSPRASADRREGRLSLAAFPIVRAGTVRRNPREKRTARIASCFGSSPNRWVTLLADGLWVEIESAKVEVNGVGKAPCCGSGNLDRLDAALAFSRSIADLQNVAFRIPHRCFLMSWPPSIGSSRQRTAQDATAPNP